jgi:hypothetical protein
MIDNKPYRSGFTRKFHGLGIMLEIDPPWAMVRKSWQFELRLGWWYFWYVKEKKTK